MIIIPTSWALICARLETLKVTYLYKKLKPMSNAFWPNLRRQISKKVKIHPKGQHCWHLQVHCSGLSLKGPCKWSGMVIWKTCGITLWVWILFQPLTSCWPSVSLTLCPLLSYPKMTVLVWVYLEILRDIWTYWRYVQFQSTAIKQITQIFFGFPVPIPVLFLLYYSLLRMQ